MSSKGIEIGDVVQINPELKDSYFQYCFMQVTEIKDWGVIGLVYVPRVRNELPFRAVVHMNYEDIERIGKAAWPVDFSERE